MPFWWRRRRRPWYGRWYKRRYTSHTKRRRKRFPRRRRRRRYARRRRRRGRAKVRRKKKTLTVKQWQPECIRRCKIKGIAAHIIGTQGKQFQCFTDNAQKWTPPLQPGGGGIAVEKFTLQHLYNEYRMGRNIWTTSNKWLDLVRYLGGYIMFWRHPHVDFVVKYTTTLPMLLDKYTYPDTYPLQIMLSRHKKYIPSLLTKSKGKRYVKIRFKPPKLLTNKWIFQETMATTGLIQIQASIADLRYPHLGCCNTNQLVTIMGINLNFYKYFAWGNPNNPIPTQQQRWYEPYHNAATNLTVTWPGSKTKTNLTMKVTPYNQTLTRTEGWFRKELMLATKIDEMDYIPGTYTRYNPTRDNGVGNKVWLASTLNSSIQPPKTDLDLIVEGLPLYQLLLGFTDYVNKKKGDPQFINSYCLFFQSPFIEPQHGTHNIFCPIDYSFMNGKGPYDSNPDTWDNQHWFPTIKHQQKAINNIVSSGPFMPKLENQNLDTWELWSNYSFQFKFGGAPLPDAEAADPGQQGTYPIPNNIQSTIQIVNPEKTTAQSTLHAWDLRRGLITKTALKRMCENQQTDTDFQTDAAPFKKKKKTSLPENALPIQQEEAEEIQSCLRSLCEKSISQESEEDLLLLINNQKLKQQQLKNNLLKLITDLKKKQKVLQLQTGVLD
nr:MAG: ORF1 [Torque teno midi virus]